ncbi:MAG: AMP-dependent synthetase/ligase [Bacteroidia bacterium]
MIQYLESDKKLGTVLPNIATMLGRNAGRLPDHTVYAEQKDGAYQITTWMQFYTDICNIACHLRELGFEPGDKMVIYSPNRLEMLEMELAVMASGGVSVPIFSNFQKETAELLIHYSGARFISVSGDIQLSRLSLTLQIKKIIMFDQTDSTVFNDLIPFRNLLKEVRDHSSALCMDSKPDDVCLNMFTSGTMGLPKCVQLTHGNILSQQAALDQIWNIDENDRFLSYLPWHHSFGGIFERFTALYHGAAIYLEPSLGKDPNLILNNFRDVKPSVFFSVPKVYQALISRIQSMPAEEGYFFHPGLKFVFTAAASLPQNISQVFDTHRVPVIEGWGLTETSPCCTLTDPSAKREQGLVGKPIPGVTIRLAEDGEIQIKGPNVMKGYYRNEEANATAFTDDGWYCTGDVGELTPGGLKLITRKDRVFKLVNGEKVIPTEMESLIQNKCHYITFALVEGSGKEYPVALLFPNKKALEHPNYEMTPDEGCFCPRSIEDLGKCLHGCLSDTNCSIGQKFARIKSAMIIDDELSIDKSTLTPSLKLAPKNVVNAYKAHLENLYGSDNKLEEDIYIIRLNKDYSIDQEA